MPPPFLSTQVDVDIDDRRPKILLEARQAEGDGRIINVSYTKDEYIHRRHGFLSKHPEFRGLNSILPDIRRAADDVFFHQAGRKDRLSSAEVRERELELDISPILPRPTSTNTATFDDFAIHERVELALSYSSVHETSASPPKRSMSVLQHVDTSSNLNNTAASNVSEFVMDTDDEMVSSVLSSLHTDPDQTLGLSKARFVSAQTHFQYPAMEQTANLGTTLHNINDSRPPSMNTIPAQQMANIMQPFPVSPGGLTDLAPAEKFYSLTFKDTGEVTKNDPSPATRDQTFAQLRRDLSRSDLYKTGMPLPADQAPAQYYRGCGEVAAVANRAISSPVKPQGKKRSAPSNLEESTVAASASRSNDLASDLNTSSSLKRQKKSLSPSIDDKDSVLNQSVAEKTTTEHEESTLPPQTPLPSKSEENSPRKAVGAIATKAPRAKPGRVVAKEDTPPPLPAPRHKATLKLKNSPQKAKPHPKSKPGIVSGANLPTSKAEATDSAHTRLQSLIASRKQTGRGTRNVEFPPEFFDIAKFSKQEREEIATGGDNGPVRCVCGDPSGANNPSGQWVACSTAKCGVWQHVDCMGEGVPEESVRDTADYKCQQCDPWTHRRLLQRLRAAQPL
jgi:hypothetical protein